MRVAFYKSDGGRRFQGTTMAGLALADGERLVLEWPAHRVPGERPRGRARRPGRRATPAA